MSEYRIGISGWRYAPWRNYFYPKGLVQKKELYFASRSVNTIEINGSFYGLQTPKSYANWYKDTPENFIFSVKAYRQITHFNRLNDIEEPLANFFSSGLLELKEKLGPILWQFPPSFKFNPDKFSAFLKLLPHNTSQAIKFVQTIKPDILWPDGLKHRQRIHHCVEIRNQSFMNTEFIELLRQHNVAFVIADTAKRWPYAEDITSDFIYMRLHGDTELYKSGYSDEAIERWYHRIKTWSKGNQPQDAKLITPKTDDHQERDVFCYFDNTDKMWAPFDARKILEKLGLIHALTTEPGKLPEELMKRKRADQI